MGPDLFATFLMLLIAISGAPVGGNGRANDLLDMIPSASYWRVKGVTVSRQQLEADVAAAKTDADIPRLVKDLESLRRRDDAKKELAAIGAPALDALRGETNADDPEAAAMASDLVATISSHAKVAAVRRLMAIRTLGERKEKESLPLLKSLLDSKEMFVADYAARAIGAIEGTPVKAEDHRADLAADLDLLPASTGMVAQTTGLGMPGFSLETLVGQAYAINHDGKPAPAGIDDTVDNLTRKVLDYAEAVGNVRVDGMTLALSSGIGDRAGTANEWIMFIVNGQYDHEAAASFLQSQAPGHTPIERNGNVLIASPETPLRILFPSDRQLIVAVANPADTPVAALTAPVIDALSTGRPGTLADNKDLMAAINATDKSGPLWAAALSTPSMKILPAFLPFDVLTLTTKFEKGAVALTVKATGTGDPVPAQDQVVAVQLKLIDGVKNMVRDVKDFQPLLDALQSVKIDLQDKGATMTATVSPDVMKSVLALMMQNLPGIILVNRGREGPVPAGGPVDLP